MEQQNNKEIINFSAEMSEHVIWNVKLRCFLDGGECITEDQVISHQHCKLGKWLYSHGMIKFGTMPEIQKLEKVHREIHATVRQIIQMKHAGEVHSAERALAELQLISNEIITLLTAVEERLN